MGVVRSLGAHGVPLHVLTYQSQDFAHVSRWVSARTKVPHPEQQEAAFMEALWDATSAWEGAVLIPADDETLDTVARHHEELSRRFIMGCPAPDTIFACIDKARTYHLAEQVEVLAPRTWYVEDENDLDRIVDELSWPCLVKPHQSHLYVEHFKVKLCRVDHIEALRAALREAREAGLQVMVQEFIAGDDTQGINFNAYCIDGEIQSAFTAEKVRLSPPYFGIPRIVRSHATHEVNTAAARLLKALNYQGYACVEFKRNPDNGLYTLMEVNARFNRSILLSTKCGLDFPVMCYEHLVHGRIPVPQEVPDDVYWIDLTHDLFTSVKHAIRERLTISSWWRPYLKPHVFSVLSGRDPRPFFARIHGIIR